MVQPSAPGAGLEKMQPVRYNSNYACSGSLYPALREAIRQRNILYNEQIELVERLEQQGEITVLRPERPIVVDRMERDTRKLLDLYDEGYECAARIDFK